MVSYFNLMIASDLCLRSHESTRGTDHDLLARISHTDWKIEG
jgi:hypothetical protein